MPSTLISRRRGRLAVVGALVVTLVALPVARVPLAVAGPAAEVPALGSPRDMIRALEPGRAARVRALVGDLEEACLPAAASAVAGATPDAVAQAAQTLRASPVGAWLIEQAAARDVLICLDGDTRFAAYYRAQLRLIGLQAALAPAETTMFLAHELAHVPQHPGYSNSRQLAVDDLILMHRMREAAAEAVATRVLWQLHHRGRSEAWLAKLESGYGDIARAFATAMARAARGDRAAVGAELQAAAAAFDRWFASSPRLERYDSHMLDHVERIAQDRPGLLRPGRALSDRFLQGIAHHAGESFLAVGERRQLTAARYRAGLSDGNAARLAGILDAAGAGLGSDAAALRDDSGVPPD